MGTKSKRPQQEKKQTRWDLGASQRQMVAGIVGQQNKEIQEVVMVLKRHHGRELLDTVNVLRGELGIPKGMKLGLDMQDPEKMFVREITAEELKNAAGKQAQQTNGDKPPSGD